MLTSDFGYWKTDKRSEGSFIAFVKQNLLKLHTVHFSTVPRLIQNPVEYLRWSFNSVLITHIALLFTQKLESCI